MNLSKLFNGLLKLLEKNKILVFVFFLVIVFVAYRKLFNSYFEADEWFHFTNYLPLTKQPLGFLSTLVSTITDTNLLSRGQHIDPIGEEIFFLNTLFFGTNFTPYAFLSLLLHSINSFLVFLLIKELFQSQNGKKIMLMALCGGVFFALSQVPMHAVVWAAFYGQNVLSVTFFLLCLIFFKKSLNQKIKKFLYLALLFLFLALFTKETSTALFLLLPFIWFFDVKVFPTKLLAKLYIIALFVFILFRFIVPNLYFGIGEFANRWVGNYVSSARQTSGVVDTKTIVSTDLSVHKNIVFELISRAVRFPVKMTSELYLPRETVFSFMQILTPIVYPLPENVDGDEEKVRAQNYNFFSNGPGNDLIIYIISVAILLFFINYARKLYKLKKLEELRAVGTGLAIIVFGSLPLVLIVLSFPRWGYDTYFDSRHYYMPSVGASILFPFLLMGISNYLSKSLSKIMRLRLPIFYIVFLLFIVWFINNLHAFNATMFNIVDLNDYPRKQVVTQIKGILPVLPQKAVFYIQTDGLGAYGPVLPFQTSVAQAFTIVYYDKNPLPNEFFSKFIFEKTGQGYKEVNGRGFGYYTSKETLSRDLLKESFSIDNIYGFYYDSQNIKIKNITNSVREDIMQIVNSKKDKQI